MKRRTFTSAEVKNRWNREHYDRVAINLPAGGREELQALAAETGQSVSAYVRALIIRDAKLHGRTLDAISGAAIEREWREARAAALKALEDAGAIL